MKMRIQFKPFCLIVRNLTPDAFQRGKGDKII